MNDLRLYHFREFDFLRIGKLLADRDAFIVFFHLARSPVPLTIAQLTSVFRRDPRAVSEILQELSALGIARRNGGLHAATSFGRKVMDFFEEVTNKIELKPAQPEAVPSVMSLSLVGAGSVDGTATNNSVIVTFAATGWARSEIRNIESVRSSDLASHSQAKNFENQDSLPNAARSHDYL
jgi:hypothetical protein